MSTMPKSRVIVEFPDRPAYPVRIGGGVADQMGADLRAAGVDAERCLVVCDSDSATRCLPGLKTALQGAGFRVVDIAIPSVEPEQAWECIAELHGAFAQLGLPTQTPVIVCACVQVTELAAFAVATYGGGLPLVLVPASLAGALRTVGVDRIELDAGYPVPVVALCSPAFAAIEPGLLACESEAEAELGLDELDAAAAYADAEYRSWLAGVRTDMAAYDEDALVLALTQVLASRADALGEDIAARI
jgi:3-dehydroquinate synthase